MALYKNKKLVFELASIFTFAVLVALSPDSHFNGNIGENVAVVQAAENSAENLKEEKKAQEEAKNAKEAAENTKEAAELVKEEVEETAEETYYDYSYSYSAATYTQPSATYAASTATNDPLTAQKGVVYYNGHRETYYSQKVLPGNGLNIPGRHVADDGTVRDADGYICVASSDHSKGTVVETSLGTAKVYDTGCASGTVDIYTNW